jgi:protoporphyrinogen oxidase
MKLKCERADMMDPVAITADATSSWWLQHLPPDLAPPASTTLPTTADVLIVGAGISGLATAAALGERDYLVLEADRAIGGYCKTVRQDGFVWDYSGHFFHFKHPEIEAWLRARMPGQNILTVEKKSFIAYKGRSIDFPFQKNIHQLPREEFLECLVDLYFRDEKAKPESFEEMLYARFGRGIAVGRITE